MKVDYTTTMAVKYNSPTVVDFSEDCPEIKRTKYLSSKQHVNDWLTLSFNFFSFWHLKPELTMDNEVF